PPAPATRPARSRSAGFPPRPMSLDAASVAPPLRAPARRYSRDAQRATSSLLERVDHLPVLLHVDHRPALPGGLVERFVEAPDRGLAVICPLSLPVGVAHDAHESSSITRSGPLEHLLVAVRIPERQDGAPPDEPVDAHGLADLVVDQIDLRELDEDR